MKKYLPGLIIIFGLFIFCSSTKSEIDKLIVTINNEYLILRNNSSDSLFYRILAEHEIYQRIIRPINCDSSNSIPPNSIKSILLDSINKLSTDSLLLITYWARENNNETCSSNLTNIEIAIK